MNTFNMGAVKKAVAEFELKMRQVALRNTPTLAFMSALGIYHRAECMPFSEALNDEKIRGGSQIEAWHKEDGCWETIRYKKLNIWPEPEWQWESVPRDHWYRLNNERALETFTHYRLPFNPMETAYAT